MDVREPECLLHEPPPCTLFAEPMPFASLPAPQAALLPFYSPDFWSPKDGMRPYTHPDTLRRGGEREVVRVRYGPPPRTASATGPVCHPVQRAFFDAWRGRSHRLLQKGSGVPRP